MAGVKRYRRTIISCTSVSAPERLEVPVVEPSIAEIRLAEEEHDED